MKYGLSVIPSIGISTIENRTAAGENTSVSPALGFSSTWNAQSKAFKGWSVKLNYHLNNALLGIGNLANSISYIDNDFISMGNPDARPYRQHSGSLRVEYMSPDGMNMFMIGVYPGYARHPLVPILSPVEGVMALRYENIRYRYSNGFVARASWHVLPWLELCPRIDYTYRREVLHDGRVSFGQWGIDGTVYVTKGNFELVGSFSPPIKRIEGDQFKRSSTQALARLRYKLNTFSVACEYKYLGQNEYTIGRADGFYYIEDSSRKSFAHCVSINLTYSFSKGKQTNHADRMLYDSTNDTGLGDFNGVAK